MFHRKGAFSMDMETLGYFLYMNEMEKQQKEQEEDFLNEETEDEADE